MRALGLIGLLGGGVDQCRKIAGLGLFLHAIGLLGGDRLRMRTSSVGHDGRRLDGNIGAVYVFPIVSGGALLAAIAAAILAFMARTIVAVLRTAAIRTELVRNAALARQHDAVIMLGMLKIVLAHDTIAARLSVTGKRLIFLEYMRRRAPDLDIRPIAVERPS